MKLVLPSSPGDLAAALVEGARIELELTPKPGLVDRDDNGSHPDLSFELMLRSIELLPRYYEELLACGDDVQSEDGLARCVAAGRRAEDRMFAEIGANAHRGYIFLSGLVLLAAAEGARSLDDLRAGTAALAARLLLREPVGSLEAARSATPPLERALPGAEVRRRLGLRGIHGEALAGLPSIVDHALPALDSGAARFGSDHAARHYAMATLMTVLEDTTAVHRCGPAGLQRLRDDGRRVRTLMESGAPYLPWLTGLNDAYRTMRLTMGGVADCLAIAIALDRSAVRT